MKYISLNRQCSLYFHTQILQAYQFTFRQEQLAKLTPSELIEVAYLGALLEQEPYSRTDHFSGRFNTLRGFFEQVVSVVPIESLVHTIGHIVGLEAADKCCNFLMSCGQDIPPSIALVQGCNSSWNRLYYRFELPQEYINLEDKEAAIMMHQEVQGASPRTARKMVEESYKKYQSKVAKPPHASKRKHQQPPATAYQRRLDRQNFHYQHIVSGVAPLYAAATLSPRVDPSHPYAQQVVFLTALMAKLAATLNKQQHHAICGMSLQHIYPVSAAPTSAAQAPPTVDCTLKPPLEILREGRKRLHWLADQAMTTPNFEAMVETSANIGAQMSRPSLSALYNAKMLAIVKDIREDDLKICTSLLAAFMEDQIQVPLIKTSIDTAKALNFKLTTAAVGVWALFSLNRGDIESIISSIPAGSLHVQVQEYIRGIFKQESLPADNKYAGKLQFMVQGLEKTVSCNSHYISYSLERQLVELCDKLSIDSSTPLQTLISEWDTIFKDDVLALVAPTHRSLIARWLKWALMVHHLREELAKYTAVGVVGLVNSGKSRLVSTLFNIRVRLYHQDNLSPKIYIFCRYSNSYLISHGSNRLTQSLEPVLNDTSCRSQWARPRSSAPQFPSSTTWGMTLRDWTSSTSPGLTTGTRLSLTSLTSSLPSHRLSSLSWTTGTYSYEPLPEQYPCI